MIYLDYNATAPMLAEAQEAVVRAATRPGNASSLHRAGQRAHRTVEAARSAVRELVGARDAEVILTSGGTEADNLALNGWAAAGRATGTPVRLVLGGIEHPAVLEAAQREAAAGGVVDLLGVLPDGTCDLEPLARRLEGGPGGVALVALMLANNETGVVQPVERAAQLCRAASVPIHVDAVQAAGKIPICFDAWGLTSLALSAHKFGGPRGIGAWVVARQAEPVPLFGGGEQQKGMRPGTIATPLCAGLAAAAAVAAREARDPRVGRLRDRLEGAVGGIAGAYVIGASVARLPNTCAVGFEGVGAAQLAAALSARGIMLGAGAACHAGENRPSRVLTAMGVSAQRALGVIRISLGGATSEGEIDAAVAALREAVATLREAA